MKKLHLFILMLCLTSCTTYQSDIELTYCNDRVDTMTIKYQGDLPPQIDVSRVAVPVFRSGRAEYSLRILNVCDFKILNTKEIP